MKTLLGIVTFGNLPFTQLAINGIREQVIQAGHFLDIFGIVGKPGDSETQEWFFKNGVASLRHGANHGFPASLNDIMDQAFRNGHMDGGPAGPPYLGRYDNLILMGNDVVPYPGALDAMMECAATTDWEWICASQYDVKSLVRDHPETARFFDGPDFKFTDFAARPWDAHGGQFIRPPGISPNSKADVRNLCLFKRSVFEKLGYADVNFWPGGYFEDNDYCRRADLAGIRGCTLDHAAYFHFWSRTIKQGDGTKAAQFERNRQYYTEKWGGPVGGETVPRSIHNLIRIPTRASEADIIKHWSGL